MPVVRIILDEDDCKVPGITWHALHPMNKETVLCDTSIDLEASAEVEYKDAHPTCEDCRTIIREIKKMKL
ncbi:hypothetical protein Phi12:1_gp15 [Cellulophaga phage phi12:1]|uniref:Uncharacterized protein n=2 Tax=Cellulophaga phage phi12:1 TaxID=1327976 RepID=R9ZXW3_9CAUD|nr:hypothetical protein Phi12:1_gp15 [Cellulophaga phage phi12:1]AGO47981.1 hypothetical protein Phi12:1_gp15 [Cellulophaga phage phi12:1]AGO48146.1 hypothetical protein Phi12:3_gp15 [Cellulophaga phage phi12:3]